MISLSLRRKSPRRRNAFTVVKTFDDKNRLEDSPVFTFEPIKLIDIEEENEKEKEELWSEEEIDVALQNDMEVDDEGEVEEEVVEQMEEEENDQITDENERCEGQGEKKYAPEYVNPYYTKIPSTDIEIFERTSRMNKFDGPRGIIEDPMQEMLRQGGYLSLKFLLDLAMNQVDWQILRRRSLVRFEYENNDKREQEEKRLKDMDFLGLSEEPGFDLKVEIYTEDEKRMYKIEDEEQKGQREGEKPADMAEENEQPHPPIWIPMRRQTGELVWMGFKARNLRTWKSTNAERVKQLAAIKRVFSRFWIKMFKGPDAEYVSGFRARYSTEIFNFNLFVVPGKSFDTLGKKPYSTRLLKSHIEAVNEKHRKSPELGPKPIKTMITNKLGKQSEIKTQKSDKKQSRVTIPKPSQDKANMELKLMARADVDNHKYVKVCPNHPLETLSSAALLRPLHLPQLTNVNCLNSKIGENPLELYSTYVEKKDFDTYMKSLETPRVKLDKPPKGMNAARSIPSEKEHQNLHKANANDRIIKLGELSSNQIKGKKKALGVGSMTTLSTEVSCLKIVNAIGNRTTKNAPGKIMGMSASQCAHDSLGWKKLPTNKEDKSEGMMLRNGLYMAEWLHLSAFSWGGLLKLPTPGTVNPQQHDSSDIPENLVLGTSETNSQMTRFEKAWQALIKDETLLRKDDTYSAVLKVVRNPDSRNPILQDGKTVKGYTRSSMSLEDSHHELAEDFKFIAYSVGYSIKFPSGCRLLSKEDNSSLSTIFYPFSRPLYHKLEAELDTLLYTHLKVVSGLIKPPPTTQLGVTGIHGILGNTVPFNAHNNINLFGPGTLTIGLLGVLQTSDKPQQSNIIAHSSDQVKSGKNGKDAVKKLKK
ncbi:hypothetical protein FGLOB1_7746 [Fusarium globosum]|uniref:Uncharacterized protein n=1 Tax=Fusarium globosum TaxID=78864 RepID=A0A8H5Y556_9HYPO|nr:hypothetical protein FGLOB1_7746 [Fusarium globosum]